MSRNPRIDNRRSLHIISIDKILLQIQTWHKQYGNLIFEVSSIFYSFIAFKSYFFYNDYVITSKLALKEVEIMFNFLKLLFCKWVVSDKLLQAVL